MLKYTSKIFTGGKIMSIEKTFDVLSDEIIKPSDIYDRIEDNVEKFGKYIEKRRFSRL